MLSKFGFFICKNEHKLLTTNYLEYLPITKNYTPNT